jgi:hypothetical protein
METIIKIIKIDENTYLIISEQQRLYKFYSKMFFLNTAVYDFAINKNNIYAKYDIAINKNNIYAKYGIEKYHKWVISKNSYTFNKILKKDYKDYLKYIL